MVEKIKEKLSAAVSQQPQMLSSLIQRVYLELQQSLELQGYFLPLLKEDDGYSFDREAARSAL